MSARAEQKQQTRLALMDAARRLMDSGRGFGSLSLREVARAAGIVPAPGATISGRNRACWPP